MGFRLSSNYYKLIEKEYENHTIQMPVVFTMIMVLEVVAYLFTQTLSVLIMTDFTILTP